MVASNASLTGLPNYEKSYNFYETPTLRIGFTENKDAIEFKSAGRFTVYNNEGIAILRNVTSPTKWRIKIEQSYNAKYCYNILLGKFLERNNAQELSYNLIEKGLGARIKTLGDTQFHKNNIINDNTQYWVIVDNFATEDEATTFSSQVLADFDSVIIKEKIKEINRNNCSRRLSLSMNGKINLQLFKI